MLQPTAPRRRFRQESRGSATRARGNASAYPPKDFVARAAVSVPAMAVFSATVGSAVLGLLVARRFPRCLFRVPFQADCWSEFRRLSRAGALAGMWKG